ncbi:MAG: hypothetical protein H0T47_13815 [Planctomycetaceae bacterium]|nr:hypothetical protein [Planctomycetaceae bacterium]
MRVRSLNPLVDRLPVYGRRTTRVRCEPAQPDRQDAAGDDADDQGAQHRPHGHGQEQPANEQVSDDAGHQQELRECVMLRLCATADRLATTRAVPDGSVV